VALPYEPVLVALGTVFQVADRPAAIPKQVLPATPSSCEAWRPTVSPNGQLLAAWVGSCDSMPAGVLVTDLAGGSPQLIPAFACHHLQWHPDGSAVLCSHQRQLLSHSIADKKTTVVESLPATHEFRNFTVSKDRRWLVSNLVTDGRADIYVADISMGGLTGTPGTRHNEVTTDGASSAPAF
jgi:hypothetical protein